LEALLKSLKNNKMQNALIIFATLILAIIVYHPFLSSAVVTDDELIVREFVRHHNFLGVVRDTIRLQMQQGRVLFSIPIAINLFIFYKYEYLASSIKVILTLSNIIIFGIFIHDVFKNVRLTGLCMVLLAIFMPLTWESMMPSIYVHLFGLSISFLLISFIAFYESIRNNKHKVLLIILTLITLLYALCTYELFVLYVPFYLCLYLYKCRDNLNTNTIGNLFKVCLPVISTCAVFIGAYLLLQKAYPSHYSGNSFAVINLLDIFRAFVTLTKASIPGYFLINIKYRYIIQNILFTNDKLGINLLNTFFINFFNAGTLCFAFSGFILIGMIFYISENHKGLTFRDSLYVLATALFYFVFPAFMMSLTKRNVEVGPQGFLAWPASYFCYFAIVFIISYILTMMLPKKNLWAMITASVLIIALALPIQAMNNVIGKTQGALYQRLLTMESFVNTNLLKNTSKSSVLAPDFYEHYYSMGFHPLYWNEYADIVGTSARFITISDGKENYYASAPVDFSYAPYVYFAPVSGVKGSNDFANKVYILSRVRLGGKSAFVCVDPSAMLYSKIDLPAPSIDQGLWVYTLTFSKPIVISQDVRISGSTIVLP
jgi:hypothetical protein